MSNRSLFTVMNRWIILFVFACFSQAANAVLKIDITEGIEGATPIAIVPFQWNGSSRLRDADISGIVSSDLARSGKFSPVAEKSLLARPQRPEDIHFKTWRVAGVDHLVIGTVQMTANDRFKVDFVYSMFTVANRFLAIVLMQQVQLYARLHTRSAI